jgi:hypothetical protein
MVGGTVHFLDSDFLGVDGSRGGEGQAVFYGVFAAVLGLDALMTGRVVGRGILDDQATDLLNLDLQLVPRLTPKHLTQQPRDGDLPFFPDSNFHA